MKAKRTFNINATLAAAKAGQLNGTELTKAISIAREMGKDNVVHDLQLILAARKKSGTAKTQKK